MPSLDDASATPPSAADTERGLWRELWPTTLGLFVFWWAFATWLEPFFRDDNVGGTAPVLREVVRRLLSGRSPTHTALFGGGGGAYLSPWFTGLSDPLALLPGLLLHEQPMALMNVVNALHFACFAAGGFYLGWALAAPRWACRVAQLALGFSGYFFVWSGNWTGVMWPYAYLPWLIAGLVAVLRAQTRRELVIAQLATVLALYGTFLTGLLFAALYGGVLVIALTLALVLHEPALLPRLAKRWLVPTAVFLLLVVPVLRQQMSLYEFLGKRDNDALQWIVFSVPGPGYLGLWWPSSSTSWRSVFFPEGIPYTNLLLACGLVPVWYLTVDPFLHPGIYKRPLLWVLLLALVAFVVIMSPGSFGLAQAFSQMPVVSAFRWPFRAIPAFQLAIVTLFLLAARERPQPLAARFQRALPLLCVALSVVALASELGKVAENGPVQSWLRAAPMLEDPETWSAPTLQVLRASGSVANVCHTELLFYEKPRLYFYGLMGAQFDVPTVHLYVVPPFRAYKPLGQTLKGCFRKWNGVRELIEHGPQTLAAAPSAWNDYRGPRDWNEIVEKTYVGAVIVDPEQREALAYFETSPAWIALERHKLAIAFARRPH